MATYYDFRRFLQENNCEAIFDSDFYAYNGCIAFDERMWEISEEPYILAHAFDWAKTPEGRVFWLEMDKRWLDFYDNIKGYENKRH